MQDVLQFILQNITTVPDDVKVDPQENGGVTNYVISVNPDDVGRVIGKEGKVIKAIRTIMRVIAIQKGVRVRVSVLSDSEDEVKNSDSEVEITPEPEMESEANQVSEANDGEEEVEIAQEDDSLTVEV